MKTRPFILTLLFFILLIAFITNPGREKHAENATQILISQNIEKEENSGMMGGLVGTFVKETVSGNIEIKNYYLFSKSHIYSERRNLKLDLGFGIFGQVMPIASEEELIAYEKAPTTEKKNTQGAATTPDNKKAVQEESNEIIRDNKVPKLKEDTPTTDALESILGEPEREVDTENSYYGSGSD